MKRILSYCSILFVTAIAFYPVFLGKIPINGRNLVAFFSPWYYEKFEGFPAGVPSKPGMLDQIRLYYPYMTLTQKSYQIGEIPLWNPYNFIGNPHMAEWQSGVFYPLHLLLPLLPLPLYWTLFQMTGFFFAGLFTYLYLRNVHLGQLTSVFGGLTYMLSSFMSTWNMEVVVTSHSILWLPFLLLSVDKFLTTRERKWWLTGVLGIVMSILSGYWQTTLYVMGVTFVYSLYRIFQSRQKHSLSFWPLGLLFLWYPLALGLTAFHLLPTWELFERSSRPVVNALPQIQQILTDYLLPTRHLVTLFVPDYFGHPTTRNYFANVGAGTYYEHALFIGTIQILLAVITVFTLLREKSRSVRGWIGGYLSKLRQERSGVRFGGFRPSEVREDTTDVLRQAQAVRGSEEPSGSRRDGEYNRTISPWSFTRKARVSDSWFWLAVTLIAASFSFKTPWAQLIYTFHVPVLSTGIANRILFVQAFGTMMLASFGFEHLRTHWNKQSVFGFMGIGVAVLGLLTVATVILRSGLGAYDPVLNPQLFVTSLRNMTIPTGIFLFGAGALLIGYAMPRTRRLSLVTIVVLGTFQNLYQHHKFTAFSEPQFVYPTHPTISWLQEHAGIDRFIGYNGQFLNNNFATQYGIYAVEGYDSLNDYRRSQLIHSAETGKLPVELPRSADAILSQNFKNPRMLRLLQLFGVRYLVDHPQWLDVGPTEGLPRLPQEKQQRLAFEHGGWRIWEYTDAYPRSFLVGAFSVLRDGQPTIDQLYDDQFNPRTSVLLTNPVSDNFHVQPDPKSSVEIQTYTPTAITFKTISASDQLLVLSDTWYPGWRAKLEDSRELPVMIADYALRAVPIPAGTHTITMWYLPETFKNGLLIAGLTTLVAGVIFREIEHD